MVGRFIENLTRKDMISASNRWSSLGTVVLTTPFWRGELLKLNR
jgi:hypothetical protein